MVYIYLILLVSLLMLSAFFAGSETGVYRLSHVRLRIGADKGKRPYKILFNLIKDGQGLILSLLLGNNLVNYFLTSLVTIIILERISEPNMAEIYATVILTPVVFVFGELIPKNLFYHQADMLLSRFAWVLWFFDQLFTYSGAKFLLKWLANLMSVCFHLEVDTARAVAIAKRHQVRQIIHETREEGLLSAAQKDMMTRLIDMPSVSVGSVMIPFQKTAKVPLSSTREDLLECLKKRRFTRQLVYVNNPNDIAGYIPILEVLGTEKPFENLQEIVKPIVSIDKKHSVVEVIDLMRNQKIRIALVTETRKHTKTPIGIITLTDLIEELIGELKP